MRNDLIFIKGFSKIKVSEACRKFGYNQGNLVQGRLGSEAEKNVRLYLEKEVGKLRLKEYEELEELNGKTENSTLFNR